MSTEKLSVVELYAGTARSSDPFRRWRQCRIGLLVDNNAYVAEAYRRNHRQAPYELRDLSNVSPAWVKTRVGGRVDILLGCPPCQGFSDNGRRDPNDQRNQHLMNFARLAIGLEPRAIAMENVPLAVNTSMFEQFAESIEDAGYLWTAGILNAAVYGSCQCRQRLVFIAIRKDEGREPLLPKPTHGGNRQYFSYSQRRMATLAESPVAILGVTPATFQTRHLLPFNEYNPGPRPMPTVGECLRRLPRVGTKAADGLAHIRWAHSSEQLRRMGRLVEGGQARRSTNYFSSSYGRLHRRGLARTITGAFPNAGSGRNWHPTENRSLTLREAARIQGFPDTFFFRPPYSLGAAVVGNALDAALADVTYRVVRGCIS